MTVTGSDRHVVPGREDVPASTDALDCSATDGDATIPFHLQFKIDKDKPTVTGASADRQPNGNGWYNGPVTVALAGSDATSGIASCQQLAYNGPDSATAGVSGTCRDVAGNVSAPFSFALKYDATPPSVSASPARDADAGGWYNHPVSVSFEDRPDVGRRLVHVRKLRRARRVGGHRLRLVQRQGRQFVGRDVLAPVRLDASRRQGRARARPGRERLVQPDPSRRRRPARIRDPGSTAVAPGATTVRQATAHPSRAPARTGPATPPPSRWL